MSRNEIILGVVALVLVGFSLVVSLVIPRRNPNFPGNRVGAFALVAVLLVAGMLATVEVFGAEEERDDVAHAENPVTEVQDSGEPDNEAGGGGAAPEGGTDGETIFAEAGCGNCHTLAAADASGTIGPNLDETNSNEETVVEQVTNGGNGMPAFGDQLSEDEIRAVARFVVESAG
ncbi:MAG: cytochrome c [Actinomycetota bacterium]|nr:cytochrome c [Actinomycetota bacterium]